MKSSAPISRPSSSAVQEDRIRILDTLKRLAGRGPSPWPVLSVYVNTRPVGTQMTTYRPFLKKRMTEELKAFHARSPEHESLAVDFARVQHYLDYDLREDTRAAAVFASYADDDAFDAIQVPVEFPEHRVTVGPLPTIFPLLHVVDRYRRVAVLVCDSNTARLFVIGLGAIEIRREVRNPVLHKPKDAGELDPSTLQRHVEEAWRRHARQAIQALEEMIRESSVSWIVIGGEESIVPALLDALAPAHRDRLLDRQAWDIRIPEVDLAAHVGRLVEERERELRLERALGLIERVGQRETVVGVRSVIAALRESRVSELVLSDAFPEAETGWVCRSCRSFDGGAMPARCPVCDGDQLQSVSLREELAAQAQNQGAPVHFVEARAALEFDSRGGVAAELRY